MEWLLKLLGLGSPPPVTDWETSGPAPNDHPPAPVLQVVQANNGQAHVTGPETSPQPWTGGWYLHAKQTPAHPGRIGGPIVPRTVVVHTTDMHPDAHDALVRSWTSSPGAGNAAHFLIGRTPAQGVKQFCKITRNSNHAGGKTHGWWKTPGGALIHPNTWAIGIELDCAGLLKQNTKGQWVHPESGRPIPRDEVWADGRKAWHTVTNYQLMELSELLRALKPCLMDLEPGTHIVPNGSYTANGVPWAGLVGNKYVGHVTLDPTNKTDPGPQVMAWLKENAP